jgi:YD repeat-containing protein
MKTTTVYLALAIALIGAPAFAAETVTYSYDDAGRLTNAAYSGGVGIAYAYDAAGQLLRRTTTEGGATTYTLIYRAGTGGAIIGAATQQVAAGESGTAVSAVEDDASAAFHAWSDGYTNPARTDANVRDNLDVTARFRSVGGADLDWYSARGIAPEPGEDWSGVDARAVPEKGTTLRQENIADTDPSDPSDRLEVLAMEPGPPPRITFRPGSTNRLYTLRAMEDLISGVWTNVPGAGPRVGAGTGENGQDTLVDENDPPVGSFYSVEVELP